MALHCPYCQKPVGVRNPRPGRYTPACPRCGKRFLILVPAEAGGAPEVRPLDDEPGTRPLPATAEFAAAPAPAAAPTPAREPADTGGPPGGLLPTGEYTPEDRLPRTGVAANEPTVRDELKGSGGALRPGEAPPSLPPALDGYRLVRMLGQGGMGMVVLARQVALDRPVALKLLRDRFARDPHFIARFTREAYAAAQLTHHNVVQIYDLGEDRGIHFFSMEYVRGRSLSDLLQESGKLDAEVAVGYVLQAARGLKYAHDLGMVHRDVKPDNLMLSEHGVVKVADLGLVKFVGESGKEDGAGGDLRPPALDALDVTRAGTAVGTPYYMAPEQARAGSAVDARADVYSLGCTLYGLVTGRPPFQGSSAKEVLSKHASEPVIPPDAVVRRVPRALSTILLKMMAKRPEDRHADMGGVIADLEGYLGVKSSGPFTPREEHADALEACVKRFEEAPGAALRRWAPAGFAAACSLAVLGALLAGQFLLAGGLVGLAVLTPVAAFLFHGALHGSPVYTRLREWVFGARVRDWGGGRQHPVRPGGALPVRPALDVAALLRGRGRPGGGILLRARPAAGEAAGAGARRGGAAPAVAAAARGGRGGAQALRGQVRRHPLGGLLRGALRLRGEAGGAGVAQGEVGRGRARSGAWREPVIDWLDAHLEKRRAARERKHLQRVEARALESEGVQAGEARRRAALAAGLLVEEAEAIQRDRRRAAAAESRADRLRQLLEAARRPEAAVRTRPKADVGAAVGAVLGRAFGPSARLLAGAALLLGFLAWVHQNGLLSGQRLRRSAESAVQAVKEQRAPDLERMQAELGEGVETGELRPLELPGVPAALTGLFDGPNAGAAALILVLSSLLGRRPGGLLAWPAALVAWVGHRLGVPAAGPLTAGQVSMVAGAALAVAGAVLRGRR